MPGPVIAERIKWPHSMAPLRKRLALIRPEYVGIDPVDRVIRYTTLKYVERNFGYAVARAYAGYNGRKDSGTTATYVRTDLYEVALALAR